MGRKEVAILGIRISKVKDKRRCKQRYLHQGNDLLIVRLKRPESDSKSGGYRLTQEAGLHGKQVPSSNGVFQWSGFYASISCFARETALKLRLLTLSNSFRPNSETSENLLQYYGLITAQNSQSRQISLNCQNIEQELQR